MKKYILLGLTLASLSFSWTNAHWERAHSSTPNEYLNEDLFFDSRESINSNNAFVEKKSVYLINILYGDNEDTDFNTKSEKWTKYLKKVGTVITRIDSNDSGSNDYTYGDLYVVDKDIIQRDYPGIKEEHINNPSTGKEEIIKIITRYSDENINKMFSKKTNKNGTSITSENNVIWRNILGLEENGETINKIDNLVNINASNLTGENLENWKKKLNILSEKDFNTIIENLVNKDGSNLTEENKKDFRKNIDVYSKDEENSLFDNKVEKDGENLTEENKKDFRKNIDVYSREEEERIFDNKVKKDGSNLIEETKKDFRKNLNVYSKEEQNKLVENKVNKDGSNLSGNENIKNRENWRKILSVETKENFNIKYENLVNKLSPTINILDEKLERENKRINAGIASAIAIANLPQPVQKNDQGIVIGVGNYNNEVGVSLGYSKIFNQNTVLKVSTGIDTQKSNVFNISFGKYMKQ